MNDLPRSAESTFPLPALSLSGLEIRYSSIAPGAGRADSRATGRRLSRACALETSFRAAVPLGDISRAPIWPEGLSGSIAHSRTLAIAAVGVRADWPFIGVDAEDPLSAHARLAVRKKAAEAEDLVGLSAAVTDIDSDSDSDPEEFVLRLAFSAKECVFKAFHAEVGEYFGFSEACLVGIDSFNRSAALKISERIQRCSSAPPLANVRFEWVGPTLVTLLAVRKAL